MHERRQASHPHHRSDPAWPEGLRADLPLLLGRQADRRQALRAAWGLGAAAMSPLALLGCGGGDASSSSSTSSTSTSSTTTAGTTTSGTTTSGTTSGTTTTADTSTTTDSGSCTTIPTETNGPYPADGTQASNQSLNALLLSGIVRSDIRASVGSASGVAAGVPLTVTLEIVNVASSCAALVDRAVYIWHCTRDGNYSMYASSIAAENYLRGVQTTGADGKVTFTTIFPGCYSGRWPHIHFEVYGSLQEAVSTPAGDYLKVSQLAMPEAACRQVYGIASGYDSSLGNLNSISLATDNVFGDDGAAHQVASWSGDVNSGFAVTLRVGI